MSEEMVINPAAEAEEEERLHEQMKVRRDKLAALCEAGKYYQDRLERKKQLGGKYDEKFFAHIQNEGEEFSEASDEDEPADGEQK